MRRSILFLLSVLLAPASCWCQNGYTLATMPRVDVHSHMENKTATMDEYMALRDIMRKELNVDMAAWISLGRRDQDLNNLEELNERYRGRILSCISDYKIADGLRFAPEELPKWMERGAAGYKIWVGWDRGVEVDHPANDPTFTKMEQLGMVAASVHIADPSGTYGRRTQWFPEPVEFWRQQHAWQKVLDRHPKLTVVNAHMLWLCHSDEQLDYLRYMLTTYKNLNVDLATSFEFMYPIGRENLRSFMIEYADRILFGTDVGTQWFAPDLGTKAAEIRKKAPNYQRYFQILETDKTVPSGLKGEQRIQGLALPMDVLEKIYYKNAARIYPRVRASLKNLGYKVD